MPPNEAPLLTTYLRDRDDQQDKTVAAVPEYQIRIEDKLYSTEKLANLHPGGPLFIKVQLSLQIYSQLIIYLIINHI